MSTLKALAQVAALTVSGIFTGTPSLSYQLPTNTSSTSRNRTNLLPKKKGFTISLSTTTVPTILGLATTQRPEAQILTQWRLAYVHGAKASRPSSAIPLLCFLYLAYGSGAGLTRWLYVFAALATGCGVLYAVTVLGGTNGALGRRCLVRFFSPLFVFLLRLCYDASFFVSRCWVVLTVTPGHCCRRYAGLRI